MVASGRVPSDKDIERRLESWIQYGKPTIKQYQCAQDRIVDIAEAQGSKMITKWYMVGDNPHSDMQGCINMNDAQSDAEVVPGLWTGVLVKTGVYSHGEDDPNEAAEIVDQVHDAVEWILKKDNNFLQMDSDEACIVKKEPESMAPNLASQIICNDV